jgi:hypothetical protein
MANSNKTNINLNLYLQIYKTRDMRTEGRGNQVRFGLHTIFVRQHFLLLWKWIEGTCTILLDNYTSVLKAEKKNDDKNRGTVHISDTACTTAHTVRLGTRLSKQVRKCIHSVTNLTCLIAYFLDISSQQCSYTCSEVSGTERRPESLGVEKGGGAGGGWYQGKFGKNVKKHYLWAAMLWLNVYINVPGVQLFYQILKIIK